MEEEQIINPEEECKEHEANMKEQRQREEDSGNYILPIVPNIIPKQEDKSKEFKITPWRLFWIITILLIIYGILKNNGVI